MHIERLEDRRLFASVPAGFTDQILVSGISEPTSMEQTPDGRIFVTQQTGELRVVKNGALLATPALTLSVDSTGERGLLGVAFDPNFANNGSIYLYYTTSSGGTHNRVSQFIVSGDTIDPASEVQLINLNPLTAATNHNGGGLHFGNDGKLYIAVGENANGANSQSLTNLLGKILRINSDGTIPTDNPFYNSTTGDNRAIWAIGLRNPFTFAFEPETGRLLINDVGASTFEEVNEGLAGANYGWPATEGPTTNPAFQTPIYFYGRDEGIAITGGVFYSPTTNTFGPQYSRDYFFADLGSGFIRRLEGNNVNTFSPFATGLNLPVDLDVTDSGSLLYLQRGGGANTGSIGIISRAAPVSTPPTASFISPIFTAKYAGGKVMTFAGRAADTQDGVLPASQYAWSIDFHDGGSGVTNLKTANGVRGGTFTVPRNINTNNNGFYRITLTVTDFDGNATTVTRDIQPKIVSITMLSNLTTGTFALDGITQPALSTFQIVAGTHHQVTAVPPADTGTETFAFKRWANGLLVQTRDIKPMINRNFKMVFSAALIPSLGMLGVLDGDDDDLRV